MKSKFSNIKNGIAGWFFRLRSNVKAIILGGFAIVILLSLVPTVFSGWGINHTGIILDRFNAVDDKIGDLSSASIAKMIRVRRNEKDFLLSYRDFGFNEAKARYITTSLSIISDIKDNMKNIRILTNDSEIIELSNKIDNAISQYQKGLVAFVDIYGILGNENTGLEGKLNSVAYDIETILKQEKNSQLMVDLLIMRMSEKDYLINDLDIHFAKLQKAAERIKTDIATGVITPDHKKKLMLMVDAYTAMFRRYVQLDDQIDATRQTYLTSLRDVEPMLEKLHYISTDNKRKTRDGIKRVERIIKTTMFSSFFFVIFLSSAMALFVLNRIKKTEDRLKMSENKYRLLFETSPDSIVITDTERNIVMINTRTNTLLRQEHPEVLIGKSIDTIIVREDRPAVEQLVKGTVEGGPLELTEFRMVKSDGSPVYVEGISSFVFDVKGDPETIILVVRDITDRKKLEEQLLQSQKLEAIGTLAGGIAHDFNNLLQGVFGYISIAKLNAADKDKNIAALQQAEKALQMSVSLTSQLRTFSKGGKPIKRKIALKPVIENSVRFALSGSRVDCRMNIDPTLRNVDAVEGQIGQVIQNIVLNADQSMPGGGTIVITAKNVNAPEKGIPPVLKKGTYVEISVRDHGAGISEGDLLKIFNPYFTTKAKGSGLGLATCYSIIKNHDGAINVLSQEGIGTAFYVYIPAIEAEIEAREADEIFPLTGKTKILLMDDEAMVREVAGEMLKVLGHEVEFAERGEDAIHKYNAALKSGNPYNVVILDLTIRGGMGGRETIERLLSLNPDIKAIVSSGYSDDAVVSDYRNYGFSSRLTKPYKLEELQDALYQMLNS